MIYTAETTDVEVTHREYGRGRVVDVHISRPDSVDIAEVYFYTADESHDVPLTTLEPAASVTDVHVRDDEHGFDISIDDGFFQFTITPDGDGRGFDVVLTAGRAEVDRCHLDYSAFL